MSEPARLSLSEAAGRLGVHYQTAYRWVRQGDLAAVKRAGTYSIEASAIDEFLERRNRPLPPPPRRVRDWEPFADRLHRHLMVGDEVGTRNLIDHLIAGGQTIADICDRAMVPALVSIGAAWRAGEISIAEEHRASSICERALGRWSSMPPGRPRGVAVICSPESDEHSLPGEMATAVLRENHWQVHHLGIGVPADAIRSLADAEGASLVVISVVYTPAVDEADHLAALLERPGRTVLVGRPGMTMGQLVELTSGA